MTAEVMTKEAGRPAWTRSRRLAVAAAVNVALVVAEVVFGSLARSSALLSDAGHNLADVATIGLSLVAVRWALWPRSEQRTYGNHRGTILAALLNAMLLVAVTCAIVAIAVVRIVHPVDVNGALMSEVGGASLVVNGTAALVLRDQRSDLNMGSAALHMSADSVASVAVVVAGVVVVAVGQSAALADPAASVAVAGLILVQAVRVVRASTNVLLESTPSDVDLGKLRATITSVERVGEVHDLHVWSLSSDFRALSAHLVLSGHPSLEEAQAVGQEVRDRVTDRFAIAHATFELECERCDEEVEDPCGVDGPLPTGRPAAI